MSLTILRLPAVKQRTGKSRSSIYQAIKDGNFPTPIKLGTSGSRSSGWIESEVEAWIEKCVKGSRSTPWGK